MHSITSLAEGLSIISNSKLVTKFLVGVAVLICATASVSAEDLKVLRGHVPQILSTLIPKGRLAATNELRLAIGLAPRDEPGLDRFIQELYDPASPAFRHYLSPEQFTDRFGPTAQDYQTLMDYANAGGLAVTHQYSNRVVLDVRGSVQDIEKAFHLTIRTYQHPSEPLTFYAPDNEPMLALNVPVLHIAGLDNYALPHPKHRRHAHHPLDNPTPNGAKGGSAPGGYLWGKDFRDAYVPGTVLTGAGQDLGLLEFEGFYEQDITNYENAIGMSATNRPQLVVVPVDGGATPQSSTDNGEECSGDIEMAVAVAPGLRAIYIFENGLTIINVHFDDIFEAMVTYTNIHQFSCSWGGTTASNATSEVLFKQMAVQGQSFFNASGDDGAFVGKIEFPSDSPSITQVGGTTLSDGSAPLYPWSGEVVWNWGTNASGNYDMSNGYGASSGGISTYYPIPSWQTNFSMTANHGSTTMRNIPDVAANADNCYFYTDNGGTSADWGGTSFAAPLWAGFMALVNQQAASNGRPPVGFMNPTLYALAAGAEYTNLFHDITSGHNNWKNSSNEFHAVVGYDLCTGLGSMNGTNLINALAAPLLPPSFVSSERNAGGFTLTWRTSAGSSYQLQYTSGLPATNWSDLGSPTNASGSLITMRDSLTATQRFYRVLLRPSLP